MSRRPVCIPRGWRAEGPRALVAELGQELVAAALAASGVEQLRTVWLHVEQRGETVRVDLDHEKRVARVEVVDEGVSLRRVA